MGAGEALEQALDEVDDRVLLAGAVGIAMIVNGAVLPIILGALPGVDVMFHAMMFRVVFGVGVCSVGSLLVLAVAGVIGWRCSNLLRSEQHHRDPLGG